MRRDLATTLFYGINAKSHQGPQHSSIVPIHSPGMDVFVWHTPESYGIRPNHKHWTHKFPGFSFEAFLGNPSPFWWRSAAYSQWLTQSNYGLCLGIDMDRPPLIHQTRKSQLPSPGAALCEPRTEGTAGSVEARYSGSDVEPLCLTYLIQWEWTKAIEKDKSGICTSRMKLCCLGAMWNWFSFYRRTWSNQSQFFGLRMPKTDCFTVLQYYGQIAEKPYFITHFYGPARLNYELFTGCLSHA